MELVNQYYFHLCHDSNRLYVFVIVVTAFRWFAQVSLSPHKFVPSHGRFYRSYECTIADFGVATSGLTIISNFVKSARPFPSWDLHVDRTCIDDPCRIVCVLLHCKERRRVNMNIQGVTGGTDQTSGECSLGQTIPI